MQQITGFGARVYIYNGDRTHKTKCILTSKHDWNLKEYKVMYYKAQLLEELMSASLCRNEDTHVQLKGKCSVYSKY